MNFNITDYLSLDQISNIVMGVGTIVSGVLALTALVITWKLVCLLSGVVSGIRALASVVPRIATPSHWLVGIAGLGMMGFAIGDEYRAKHETIGTMLINKVDDNSRRVELAKVIADKPEVFKESIDSRTPMPNSFQQVMPAVAYSSGIFGVGLGCFLFSVIVSMTRWVKWAHGEKASPVVTHSWTSEFIHKVDTLGLKFEPHKQKVEAFITQAELELGLRHEEIKVLKRDLGLLTQVLSDTIIKHNQEMAKMTAVVEQAVAKVSNPTVGSIFPNPMWDASKYIPPYGSGSVVSPPNFMYDYAWDASKVKNPENKKPEDPKKT